MSIQKKLLGALVLIVVFIIFSIFVFIFMMSPVSAMREEEKKLFALRNSFREELQIFSGIVIQPFEYTFLDYKEAIKKTDLYFEEVSKLKVLPNANKEIADALTIIMNMKELIDQRRSEFIKKGERLIEIAQEVFYFTKSFTYLSIIQSERIKKQELYPQYQSDFAIFLSKLLIVIDTLKPSAKTIIMDPINWTR